MRSTVREMGWRGRGPPRGWGLTEGAWFARPRAPPRVAEQDPAGAAGERLRGLDEFPPPPGHASEVLLEHRADRVRDLVALAAEVPEVQLVERDGAHRDQLFAFEGADPVPRHTRLEPRELATKGVQGPDGAAVIVLVVADDHSLRDAIQRPRPDYNRSDVLVHGRRPLSAACWLPADRHVVEGRDRIGLRPQPHAARGESRVVMVQMQRAVEPRLDVVAHGDEAHGVPLPDGRRLHARGGELPAAAIVRVEAKVVLEGVGPDDVVFSVVEAKHDAARGVFPARDRLELHGDV